MVGLRVWGKLVSMVEWLMLRGAHLEAVAVVGSGSAMFYLGFRV